MRVSASVPMRIDLAGGTLDVYPLYLFEGGGLTVNAAIDIMATVEIETRDDRQISVRSTDLGVAEEIASLEAMAFGGPLDLAKRALGYYRPESGLDITLHSEAPRGSGIGASSALLVALSSCLNVLTGRGFTFQEIIDIGANIEAQVVRIPTGKQDYFPPLYGGVCAIWFDVDGWRMESLSHDTSLVDALNQRLVVSFTGIPHSSAVTNWAMLKRYIENEGDAVARMSEIKGIALAMRDCLVAGDMIALARLLDAEWNLRRGLAPDVSTPEIESIMGAARSAGALASKICGAGGGGCMVTVAEPDRLPSVRRALERAGAELLSAQVVSEGLCLASS